jgi:hypothetical protein
MEDVLYSVSCLYVFPKKLSSFLVNTNKVLIKINYNQLHYLSNGKRYHCSSDYLTYFVSLQRFNIELLAIVAWSIPHHSNDS